MENNEIKQPQPMTAHIPIPATPHHLFNLVGTLKTVTTAPTSTTVPKGTADSILLYVDSLSSPTVMRIYAYSAGASKWGYVALTIV